MQKFTIELSAEQVGWLYEMCEFCTSAIHQVSAANDTDIIPDSFGQVMSIQDLLDIGHPTLLEQSGQQGKPYEIAEFAAYLKSR